MTFQNLSHYIHYYYLRLGVTYSQTENILSTNFIHIIKQRARRRGVGGFPHLTLLTYFFVCCFMGLAKTTFSVSYKLLHKCYVLKMRRRVFTIQIEPDQRSA